MKKILSVMVLLGSAALAASVTGLLRDFSKKNQTITVGNQVVKITSQTNLKGLGSANLWDGNLKNITLFVEGSKQGNVFVASSVGFNAGGNGQAVVTKGGYDDDDDMDENEDHEGSESHEGHH